MKVRNVHSREIEAPAERVGPLIDSLGSAHDRLWPADLWPTTPFELAGPLAVGTQVRQGQIRQAIEVYEPGRRIVFRFSPGLGLVGTHRLEVHAVDEARTRLVHHLECRVEPKLLALYPVLIRQHDALVEDLLDRAELAATGRVAQPARWALSVRVANAVELRAGRLLGALVPVTLTSIAALHVAWVFGWRWPGGSDRALAEHVLSAGERARLDGELPPEPVTLAVAAALLAAAAIVHVAGTGFQSRLLRAAAWAVATVLLARGVVYVPTDLAGGLEDTYERLDLVLYSPLCLVLGAGTTIALRRTRTGGAAGVPTGRRPRALRG